MPHAAHASAIRVNVNGFKLTQFSEGQLCLQSCLFAISPRPALSAPLDYVRVSVPVRIVDVSHPPVTAPLGNDINPIPHIRSFFSIRETLRPLEIRPHNCLSFDRNFVVFSREYCRRNSPGKGIVHDWRERRDWLFTAFYFPSFLFCNRRSNHCSLRHDSVASEIRRVQFINFYCSLRRNWISLQYLLAPFLPAGRTAIVRTTIGIHRGGWTAINDGCKLGVWIYLIAALERTILFHGLGTCCYS